MQSRTVAFDEPLQLTVKFELESTAVPKSTSTVPNDPLALVTLQVCADEISAVRHTAAKVMTAVINVRKLRNGDT